MAFWPVFNFLCFCLPVLAEDIGKLGSSTIVLEEIASASAPDSVIKVQTEGKTLLETKIPGMSLSETYSLAKSSAQVLFFTAPTADAHSILMVIGTNSGQPALLTLPKYLSEPQPEGKIELQADTLVYSFSMRDLYRGEIRPQHQVKIKITGSSVEIQEATDQVGDRIEESLNAASFHARQKNCDKAKPYLEKLNQRQSELDEAGKADLKAVQTLCP